MTRQKISHIMFLQQCPELAQTWSRYQDVAALEATGLLIREGKKLSALWDELQARVSLLAY
ncbi:MAG: hypothetical protein ORN28_01005 [Rhodoferax sp.]|nr:hypothetical protein [Rhodoferax sp.]